MKKVEKHAAAAELHCAEKPIQLMFDHNIGNRLTYRFLSKFSM